MKHDLLGCIPGMKDGSNSSVLYTTLTNWRIKNTMIISIDTEKAFDKIQHLFMIKIFNKVGIEYTST